VTRPDAYWYWRITLAGVRGDESPRAAAAPRTAGVDSWRDRNVQDADAGDRVGYFRDPGYFGSIGRTRSGAEARRGGRRGASWRGDRRGEPTGGQRRPGWRAEKVRGLPQEAGRLRHQGRRCGRTHTQGLLLGGCHSLLRDCLTEDCLTEARWTGKRLWCMVCAKEHPGSVNVHTKKCEDCGLKQANYGVSEQTSAHPPRTGAV
jgi:hypothetical protein